MELTAKQIYNAVDDWYKTKFNERGYVAPFVSVAAMNDGITAYDYLLTPVDKGRITRAASALNPLLHEYANNPNMTFDIDVLRVTCLRLRWKFSGSVTGLLIRTRTIHLQTL